MKLISFTGKKQSGKDTLCNFVCRNGTELFGLVERYTSAYGKIHETPIVLKTGFADELKDFCIKFLGLTHKQCYGTDEDKNTNSTLTWKSLPTYERDKAEIQKYLQEHDKNEDFFMTSREVLQQWGTNVFREINPNIWVNLLKKKIEDCKADIVTVCDTRFANEIEMLQGLGGVVIRLTRGKSTDGHSSETALNEFDGYDATLDNANMTILESEKAATEILKGFKWIQ